MRYLVLVYVLSCTSCFAQDGPINIHLVSGKVVSTSYVYFYQPNGFRRAHVRLSKNTREGIVIDSVDHVEGVDDAGRQRFVRPMNWRLSTIWSERVFQSDRIEMYDIGLREGGLGTPSVHWSNIQYTKDGGPLTKLRTGKVRRDVSDNPEAMSHVRKAIANSVVQGAFYTAGGILVITAAAKDLASVGEPGSPPDSDVGSKVPTGFIAGAVCLALPWLFKASKQKNLVEALKVYK